MKKLSEDSIKRYDAFWENSAVDRFLTYIVVGDYSEPRPDNMTDQEWYDYKWTDVDFRMQNAINYYGNANYYLDGFTTQFINFGPGSLAACIGGNHECAKDTIWFDRNPIIKDWSDYPEPKFDENSFLWQKTLEFTDKVMATEGMVASLADLGGIVDIIASLRGSQELLFDMYDYPDDIKALIKKIQPLWKQAYTIIADKLFKKQGCMTTWIPVWCRERYSALQCDFSAMLSPDMFEEFVLPDLIDSSEFLDKSIYHLDGPGELPHVDHLLTMPRLNAIQWVPGAGSADVADECWFEMYDKIQAAGKGVVLFSERPDMIENLINHISPNGAYILVSGCDDYTARKLIEKKKKKGLKK